MGRPTTLVRTTTLVASGAYSVLLLSLGLDLPEWAEYLVSFLPTVAVGLVVAWDLWLWRAPYVQQLVRRPDLRGLWRVTLTMHPDSKLPADAPSGPVYAFLEVTQSYWSVHTRLYTAESSSRSTATTWLPTFESSVDNLTYTYDNTPRNAVSHRSARSMGSCTLMPASINPREMTGSYFTDRYAKGDMDLVFVDRSKGYATFDAAKTHADEVQRAAES